MVTGLLYLLAFVVVLSLVVIVHEGGHFLVARLCGVRVEEFSLGFGKELWGRVDRHGTRWKVCLWPLGGYVKMLGDMDAASAKSSTDHVPAKLRPYTFMAQKLWKRAAIIFAGPATNYIFAVLVLALVLFFTGQGILSAVVSDVEDDSVAEKIGILAGDKILKINDQDVNEFSDVQRAIRLTSFEQELVIVLDRDGEELTVRGIPEYVEDSTYPRLGIRSSFDNMEERDVGFFEAFALATDQVANMTADTLRYLGQVLFHHRAPKDMRGPLGIAEAAGDAFQGGFLVLILFTANISVAIGLMNLLPIPLLDGGHLAFYLVEALFRKPLPEKVQTAALWVGFSILIGMLGYTMILDIPRITQRIFG